MYALLPQTLQKEIQGHQPRIDDIFERSQNIVTDSSLNAEAIRQRLADLKQLWGLLIEETEKRHRRLEEAHKAQQYYFDAAEAEAWMSEQELYMMSEEKAKVRQGGRALSPKPCRRRASDAEPELVHRWGRRPCETFHCRLGRGGSVVHTGGWNLALCPSTQSFLV